ncbi:sodium-coupled monocarboxylate transporter 2 isoform X1 [Gallus gallus]|uniref:Solute carrier family 5 member 12 n=1 Tax=Gallus gallus TaxID=9031 RepID=F1NJG7_CHICK|nr:sodium-coupled monocarboxylate transporter 2 isoform X1 [Gallus gallus]XP_428889.1 sodium-coupled monocarboxylate transporter 2 isoform X1 [Gallus gallus]|eukprot:XP_428889.1 sodium-coupled monocarboxylate transporter 2 [Gallus gallus]
MSNFVAPEIKKFVVWDYVVFAGLFLVCASIGVFFAIKERKKKTSKEFLVGGKQMSCGPIAFSLTSSFMSAVTVLGTPSEVYRYGASFVLFFLSYTFVIILTSELFLPVFYRSDITSTYEYLELRFNKTVRLAATLIYILQTILYTGIVVYAPSLALNQVTGFDLWGSVVATGIVCTFYCTTGGLKAVVWADAFQMVIMVLGFVTVLIRGTILNGGSTRIWEDAYEGSRLNIFDFDVDPLRRHTFWTIVIGGTFTWLGLYGVNQSTIQRCISCKSEKHAKMALYLNLLGLWIVLVCAVFSGLVMYAHYKNCDPWTADFISAPDQLMPYFVMDIFSSMPGVPGLFVACAFSGTLSTVAASINALATVTFEDLVRKCFPNLSEKTSTWTSKGLCILYGVLCTSMAGAASLMGGVVQAALSIHGMCGGPMLGLFTLGIIFPCVNWKGAIGGFLTGITLAFWVGIGSFIYPAQPVKTIPLELSTLNCTLANSTALSTTATPIMVADRPLLADTWYSLSYLYFSTIGCLGCIISGLLISFATGPTKGEDIRPVLIKPVCNFFCFWSERLKMLLWCGVQHNSQDEDFEKNLPAVITDTTGTEDTFKNNINKENTSQLPGYNPEEKSYTNMSKESRL